MGVKAMWHWVRVGDGNVTMCDGNDEELQRCSVMQRYCYKVAQFYSRIRLVLATYFRWNDEE